MEDSVSGPGWSGGGVGVARYQEGTRQACADCSRGVRVCEHPSLLETFSPAASKPYKLPDVDTLFSFSGIRPFIE